MSRYTRQMLIKAFAELAQERPLNRINVSEIVSRCAVHRNTFYYYFDDIHHLVNQFLEEEKTRLSALSESAGSWEEAISIFVNYASENRKILKNISDSFSVSMIQSFFGDLLMNCAKKRLEAEAGSLAINQEDLDILSLLIACSVEGLIVGWIGDTLHVEPEAVISRACLLLEGAGSSILQRANELRDEPVT